MKINVNFCRNVKTLWRVYFFQSDIKFWNNIFSSIKFSFKKAKTLSKWNQSTSTDFWDTRVILHETMAIETEISCKPLTMNNCHKCRSLTPEIKCLVILLKES